VADGETDERHRDPSGGDLEERAVQGDLEVALAHPRDGDQLDRDDDVATGT
jgi:hypothetical protein